jgi:hypothetical protein
LRVVASVVLGTSVRRASLMAWKLQVSRCQHKKLALGSL